MNRLDFLKTIPFLAAVPEPILVEMERHAADRRYQPGDILIRAGERGEFLLVLRCGVVNVVKDGAVLTQREAGDILGEMALLESQPRFADVVAVTEVEAVEIPFGPFRQVGHDAATLRRMLAALSHKLRQAQEARLREFHRREQELQGLADLQRAFLSVINHELTTPISNALLSQEVLGKFAARDGWPAMAQESLVGLQQHLRLAQRQVRALVDYAGLIAGQGEMFMQPVEMAELARRVMAQAGRPIEAGIAGDLPPLVGDRLRLADALGHLVDNAVKFSPSEHTVKARLWAEAGTVRFEVIDRGPGIPPEQLAGIWQPFRQQASALRRGVEGLGLGLPLTQYIVTAHGGQTWVESKVGQGSRFGFWLPVAEQ
ncbi:MAG: Adaptive-response sensory-kinase SasA [Anaerolineae bacterium]|nr:Adaptive-response sensory-kinase SasA [Anaerolineae bacterium]